MMLLNKGLPKVFSQMTVDSVWVSLGFGLNAVSALLAGMLLTRILDVASVGVYFLAFSLITIFSMASQLGLSTTVVRIISSATVDERALFLRKTIIKMLLIVMAASAFVALIFLTDSVELLYGIFPSLRTISSTVYLLGLLVFLTAIRMFLSEVFRGFGDIKHAALYQRILPNVLMLSALLLIYVANYKIDLAVVFYILLMVGLIVIIFAFFKFKKELSRLPGDCSLSFSTLFSSSTPIAAGQICQLIFTHIPLWMLGATALAEDVASYGIAFRLSALISLPLLISNNVIMPHVAKQYAINNKRGMNNLINNAVVITSFISIVFLMVFIFFGDFALSAFFGKEYELAYLMLVIIGFGHAVNVFSGAPAVVLAMSGKEVYILYSNLIASVVMLFASIAIVPVYGGVGAAVVTALGLVIVNVVLSYYCYKITGYKTYMSILAVRAAKNRFLG